MCQDLVAHSKQHVLGPRSHRTHAPDSHVADKLLWPPASSSASSFSPLPGVEAEGLHRDPGLRGGLDRVFAVWFDAGPCWFRRQALEFLVLPAVLHPASALGSVNGNTDMAGLT
jgi:hypothetical protein